MTCIRFTLLLVHKGVFFQKARRRPGGKRGHQALRGHGGVRPVSAALRRGGGVRSGPPSPGLPRPGTCLPRATHPGVGARPCGSGKLLPEVAGRRRVPCRHCCPTCGSGGRNFHVSGPGVWFSWRKHVFSLFNMKPEKNKLQMSEMSIVKTSANWGKIVEKREEC